MELGVSSCTTYDREDQLFTINEKLPIYYDLNHPTATHIMPEKLVEISGISWFMGQIICVEDELGKIYFYDPDKNKVTDDWKFGSDGDYEDIQTIRDKVYVLESDGDLFEIDFSKKRDKRVKKRENKLSRIHDTEGLGYDPYTGNLLIACKESVGLDDEELPGAPIYTYSWSDDLFVVDPFYLVTAKALKSFFEANRDYEYEEERIQIKPSAISFNPLDSCYYIVSSVGKLMIVINVNKEIKGTYSIPAELLIQPEGIAFTTYGEMWISSEGKDSKGRILKYDPINRRQ